MLKKEKKGLWHYIKKALTFIKDARDYGKMFAEITLVIGSIGATFVVSTDTQIAKNLKTSVIGAFEETENKPEPKELIIREENHEPQEVLEKEKRLQEEREELEKRQREMERREHEIEKQEEEKKLREERREREIRKQKMDERERELSKKEEILRNYGLPMDDHEDEPEMRIPEFEREIIRDHRPPREFLERKEEPLRKDFPRR